MPINCSTQLQCLELYSMLTTGENMQMQNDIP